jgi:hypothetical protein
MFLFVLTRKTNLVDILDGPARKSCEVLRMKIQRKCWRARNGFLRRALIACLLGMVGCHHVARPQGQFTLFGRREFVSESSEHVCQMLRIGGRNFGWVNSAFATNVGVIAQTCDADVSSQWALDGGALTLGSDQALGYLGDWTVFPLRGAPVRPLALTGLSGFSSPAFCGDFVAYWDVSGGDDHKPIMRVSLLATGAAVHAQSSQHDIIGTDYAQFYATPRWQNACATARFVDPVDGEETIIE